MLFFYVVLEELSRLQPLLDRFNKKALKCVKLSSFGLNTATWLFCFWTLLLQRENQTSPFILKLSPKCLSTIESGITVSTWLGFSFLYDRYKLPEKHLIFIIVLWLVFAKFHQTKQNLPLTFFQQIWLLSKLFSVCVFFICWPKVFIRIGEI